MIDRRWALVTRLGLLLSTPLTGCGDDDAASHGGGSDAGSADAGSADAGSVDVGTHACDPLVGSARDVTLGEVLAVGRSADGTVYLLDQTADGDLRAFVSDSEVLRRRRVLGSGSGDLGDVAFYDIDVEGETPDDPPFHLYLEIPDEGERTFNLIATPGRNTPDAAADGEDLELLSEADLADFTLQNLPPEVTIEYHAALDDGRRVLVTRPIDDWSYEDFRVFVGKPERVLEREVKSVLRARDGGSTTIELTLDGEAATLSFPVVYVNDMIVPGRATLERAGEELDLELLPAQPDAIDGLSVFCR